MAAAKTTLQKLGENKEMSEMCDKMTGMFDELQSSFADLIKNSQNYGKLKVRSLIFNIFL